MLEKRSPPLLAKWKPELVEELERMRMIRKERIGKNVRVGITSLGDVFTT